MKSKVFLLLVMLYMHNLVNGQGVDQFTLEQCITYAYENQANVKNATLDEEISQYKVKETLGIGLPQISGEATTMYNIQLKPMFLTAENAGNFMGGPIPGTNPTDVIALNNIFQLKAMNDVALNASQILFNGSYLVGLKASKTYSELASKSLTQTKIETVEKITKAFYLVLINEQRLELLRSNIARLDSTYNQLKALNENGMVEKLEVNRIEVALNNLKTEELNVQNLISVTYSLLKYQMGYPVTNTLTLNGSLENLVTEISTIQYENPGSFDYGRRIEYSLLETQKKLQTLEYKNSLMASVPTLTAFGSAGMVNMQNDYFKLYTSKYYGYGFVGAKLSVPIFSGLSRYSQQQQAKIGIQKVDNTIGMMKEVIDLQIQQTQVTLKNNIQSIQSQKRNLELANDVINVTKAKYKEGVGTNLDMVDAENSFKTAQINYYNSVYDALISLIEYEKAVGNLVK
jgi:outer membrane protein TolC